MDVFIEMLPQRLFGDPAGMVVETVQEQGMPSVVVKTGPVMTRAMRGMRRAVAAMAAAGNDLVVDDVMLRGGEADEYGRC